MGEEAEDRRVLSSDRGGVIGIAFQAPSSEELIGPEHGSDDTNPGVPSSKPQELKYSTAYPKCIVAQEELLPFSFGADPKPSSYEELIQTENKKQSQDPVFTWQEKEIGDSKQSSEDQAWMFRFRPHFGWGI